MLAAMPASKCLGILIAAELRENAKAFLCIIRRGETTVSMSMSGEMNFETITIFTPMFQNFPLGTFENRSSDEHNARAVR